MKKLIRSSLLAQVLLSLPLLANAELVQSEMYGGASIGVPNYDKLNTSDVGFKLYGGYMLYDYLGLDIAYVNLGNPTNNNLDLKLSGFSVSALGNIPVNNQISLFAKVGTFVWSASGSGLANDSGNDLNFGIGANFNASDNIFIHGEVEQYNADEETVLMYSIGVLLGF